LPLPAFYNADVALFYEVLKGMEIHVNGAARSVSDGLTVAALLAEMGIATGRIAVELNRQIVPKMVHGTTRLSAGDQVEVVTFVGGG
jgi:thiamine biosynthesis protein ThiS